MLCPLLLSQSLLCAASQVLPDELTLNVGDIEIDGKKDGKDKVIVLRKRSVRSEQYVIGTWSETGGFRKLEPFPVSTYRGFVQGNPAMRVNANIEPGGILNANFSYGRGNVASITGLKISIPGGKCTPLMSAGNKVVPVKATRVTPTPGGYLVPPQPMRRIEVILEISKGLLDDIGGDIETAVSQNEQRVNDADFFYARDIGVAWEVNTVIVRLGNGENGVQLDKIRDACPGRHGSLYVYLPGIHGKAKSWGGGVFKRDDPSWSAALSAASVQRAAGGLGHEAGHKFQGAHNMDDPGDCLSGAASFIGSNDSQLMIRYCEQGTEKVFPGVVYSDALPPFAMDDFANATKDTAATVDVLDNDYDGNGDAVSLQSAGPTSEKGGSVALSDDRKTVLYTPPQGFVGIDRFTYTVADATGIPNPTGRVKVDVRTNGPASYLPLDKLEKGKLPDLGPWKTQGAWWAVNPVFYKGVRGNALYNDTLDARGYVYFPDTSNPGRWSLSVSLWVLYPDSESLKKSKTIICQGGPIGGGVAGDGALSGWGIGHLEGGKGFKFVGNIARNRPEECFDLRSEEVIRPNTWYHLAVVFDRQTKKMRAWANNKEVLKSDSRPNIPDGVMDSYSGLYLFNGYGWKHGDSCRALVDEIRIYTAVLTPEEVAALYDEGRNAEAPDFKNGMVRQPPEEGGGRRGRRNKAAQENRQDEDPE